MKTINLKSQSFKNYISPVWGIHSAFNTTFKKNHWQESVFRVALVLLSLFPISVTGQMTECHVDYDPSSAPPPSAFNSAISCPLVGMSESDYLELSEFTLYVNFHFVANALGDNFHCDPNGDPVYYAPAIVSSLVNLCNNYFDNPIVNQYGNPGQVYDSRLRLKVYTETGNPDDLCGGLFFHPNNVILGTSPYGNKVFNITFSNDAGAASTIRGGSTGGPGSNYIQVRNMLTLFQSDTTELWTHAKIINHEFGHIFNLPHAFSCFNNCYDMDNVLECGGPNGCLTSNDPNNEVPCTTLPASDCNPTWGYILICCYCNRSASENFMGYGDNRSMTPCQWETMFDFILNRNWTRASFCDKQEPILYIPTGSNVVWDKLKLLNRDVVVETGATLTITCEVRMGEKHRIVVHRGGKLIVDGGKITNLCPDTRWEGISVHGNSTQAQPNPFGALGANDAGVVHIKNNSIIEHAQDAIITWAPGWNDPELYWGGVVIAEDSKFVNNRRAAGFMKYDFDNESYFKGCTIIEEGNWADNTIGVTIWDCDGILFENNTFQDLDLQAIYGIDYGAKIINSNHFINCDRGVEILATAPFNSWLDIGFGGTTPNVFKQNNIHVLSNATAGLRIHDNEFGEGDFGVWIEGDARFDIADNTFYQESQGVVNWQTGDFSNFIRNNSFTTAGVGIDIRGRNANLLFEKNCFSNTGFDVNIDEINSVLGQVRTLQGSFTSSASNCFAPANSDDIRAQQASTVYFRYYAPSTPSLPCQTPSNNLSDGGTNNYQLGYAPAVSIACENDPKEEKLVVERQDLLDAWQVLATAQAALNATPESISAIAAYTAAKEDKDHLLTALLRQYIANQQWNDAEITLAEENTKEAKRWLYGLHLLQNDYSAAQTVLNTYPSESSDDAAFLSVQNINLLRAGESTFALNATQKQTLETIAASDLPNRGYAKALLALLLDTPFEVALIAPSGAVFQAEIPEIALAAVPAYQIYPNPVTDYLTIQYPVFEYNRQHVEFIDLNGRVLLTRVLDDSGKLEFSTASLPHGIYQLRIRNDGLLTFSGKLVVIR